MALQKESDFCGTADRVRIKLDEWYALRFWAYIKRVSLRISALFRSKSLRFSAFFYSFPLETGIL